LAYQVGAPSYFLMPVFASGLVMAGSANLVAAVGLLVSNFAYFAAVVAEAPSNSSDCVKVVRCD